MSILPKEICMPWERGRIHALFQHVRAGLRLSHANFTVRTRYFAFASRLAHANLSSMFFMIQAVMGGMPGSTVVFRNAGR
jgi:hypothetical protein